MKKLCIVLVLFWGIGLLQAQVVDWIWAYQSGGSELDSGKDIATDSDGNTFVTGYFYDTATFGSTTLISNGYIDIYIAKSDIHGNWLWAQNVGGTNSDYGMGITIDTDDNCFVTGYFSGSVNFGGTTLTSSGGNDVFVAKLDSSGNWLWAKKAGGPSIDEGFGISADSFGNCYLTGRFFGTASFGGTSITSSGSPDIYVAKLNGDGNWQWVIKAGGAGFDQSNGICTDPEGGCYVTGYFQGTADFGSITFTSSGYADIFISKLDSNGNWIWVKQAGATGWDEGFGIATDASGNCYVTGTFQASCTFGDTTLTSGGSDNTFVVKLDTNGNWLWVSQVYGASSNIGYSIAVELDETCYVTGSFKNSATFGSNSISSFGENDIYVSKLNSNGNWLWAKQGGGTDDDLGNSIALDSNGYCYVTGHISSAATFGDVSLTNNGSWDIFIAKIGEGVSNEDIVSPSASFTLKGNYPNPFSTQTFIKYEVTKHSPVKIDVYNTKGQLVQTLISEPKTAGTYDIQWNGLDKNNQRVACGIYFYTMTSNTHKSTRKLIVLR